MNWTPKTDDELERENLCAAGKAPFTVMEASEQTSKSGKPMIKLKLNVHADDGHDYHVYDYVSPEFMHFKFKHFFYSVGQGSVYDAAKGFDCRDLVNREGWCEVDVQDGKGGYPAKNIITDYLVKTVEAKGQAASEEEDDSIPF